MNSSCLLNNEIAITGYNMANVYIYNISNNSYTNGIGLKINCPKVIFRADNNIYVINQTFIYKSSNLVDWNTYYQTADLSLPNNRALMSCPIRKQEYIYFLYSDYVLSRFNLKSVQFEIFKHLSLQ